MTKTAIISIIVIVLGGFTFLLPADILGSKNHQPIPLVQSTEPQGPHMRFIAAPFEQDAASPVDNKRFQGGESKTTLPQ